MVDNSYRSAVSQNESSLTVSKKTSLTDIDTTKSLTATMNIVDESVGSLQPVELCGAIVLSPAECSALIVGWLSVNKKWRGTFNKSLSQDGTKITATFNYSTFARILGCHGYPCSADAADVIIKLWNWKTQSIPIKEIAPCMWNASIERAGKSCVFVLLAERVTLSSGATQ